MLSYSVRLNRGPLNDRRRGFWRRRTTDMGRWLTVLAVLLAGAPVQEASAAICQQVQSGTAANNANGIQTIAISSVDTTKSILIFQARSNSNRPVGSEVRGRLASATTIQFERVTDEGSPAVIDIQWYVATFGSGVTVQRGEVTQSATSTNVAITAVGALSSAFVLWSKTAVAADAGWGADDSVLGELTSTSNLQFRANTANAGHIIAWQVVEFTNAADINVQKGSIATMTGATTSVTATIAAVNVNKTFILAGVRTTDGSGPDIGAKMIRAQLTDATTITFDRSAGSTSDVTEIVWQAVELKDASIVWSGNASFAAGTAVATAIPITTVNTKRAVAFISTQGGGGQNTGRSSYVGDDLPGVGAATAGITPSLITLTRNSTVSSADLQWFIVQFDGGAPFKAGTFTKSTAAATVAQTIAHGLGQVPKALMLWTDVNTGGIAYRSAASAGVPTGVLSLTINIPAGTEPSDVMTASIALRASTAVLTAPAGWTLVRRTNNANTNANSLVVFYKVAGAAEPASYTWTADTSTGMAGGIVCFSGVDTANPVDVEAGQISGNTQTTTFTSPSVTTTVPNDMIVTSFGVSSSELWTGPATEVVDVQSEVAPFALGMSLDMSYVLKATAGATGTKTATLTSGNNGDVGNEHTLALRPATQSYFGYGMSDGTISKSISTSSQNGSANSTTNTRIATKVLTIVRYDGTLLAEADLQSWDDTNITLSWTANDAGAYAIHYLAMGGTDLSAKVVGWTTGTTTGNVAVAGVGFQPNVVFHAHASYLQTAAPASTAARGAFGFGAMDADGDQWANAFFTTSGSANGNTQRGQQTDAAIFSFSDTLAVQKKASFVSMNAGGFTVNFTNSTSANNAQVISLALAGLNVKVGNFSKSTAAQPATQAITGVGFTPGAVLLTSFQDVAQAAPVAHTRFAIGVSDGTVEASTALQDQDGAATMNVKAFDKSGKAFMKMNNSTPAIDAEADVTSMDADGFTLNWTTNDAVATQILYVAMAPLAVTEVRLISFTAAKYDKGVLLQWKTGREIDNLGFNLYRDIEGVRTRVNPALIAGSGLVAGRGTRANAGQSYARWDLDPAARSKTVLYWLEDLDFHGKRTLHGPVAIHASGPQTLEHVDTSADLRDLGHAPADRTVFFDRNPTPASDRLPALRRRAAVHQWQLAAQAPVKMGIRASGWYRVTQPELVAAGLSPAVDPTTLQLFVDGAEQAMRVTGEADGRFDPADTIEFYGTGVDTAYTDTRVYWLQAGLQRGERIRLGGYPVGISSTGGPANFWSTLQRKDRSVYFAALKNGDTENWFGPLVSGDPTVLTLTPDHLDRESSGAAELAVTLQGVTSESDGNAEHRVRVLVNGTEVGVVQFPGQTRVEGTFAVPVSILVDGENAISLIAAGGDTDYSLVDVIRLGYWHTYRADADRLRFLVNTFGAVTIGGFVGGDLHVVDITDPSAAVELRGRVLSEAGGGSYAVTVVPGQGPRTLIAFSGSTVAAPAFVRANHPSTWHAPSQAHDYVVVSHADFLEQVAPLASLREQQGHHAAVVDIEDVYDEFSFGEKTPQALRDFLQLARDTWAEAPRFVVLAGDATLDPRDYAGLGSADFVSTRHVAMSQVALETASDDWFVDFDDDGLPDVPIGRLSVRTAAQAQATVSKIIGYDQTSQQPWTKDVLLVADQADDVSDFERFSDRLVPMLPAGYTANRVSRAGLGAEVAHQALMDAVNQGQLIVNYSGHGSVRLWGSNGELLNNGDVASWRNDTRLPFVVAMNCLNGFFDGIYDEESLAEALLRAPTGGAVAVWASSSVTPPATQALLDQELFRLIFGGAYATVGEAISAAKRAVSNVDLRRSWIFFGDPAMRLIGAPEPQPATGSRRPPAPLAPAPPAPREDPTASPDPPVAGDINALLDARGDSIRLVDFNADGRADKMFYAADTGRWADSDEAAAIAVRDRGVRTAAVTDVRLHALEQAAYELRLSDPAWHVVAADLNSDGRADLLFYRRDTGEWVQALTTLAGDTFAFTRGRFAASAPRAQLRIGDFNGDRRDDLLIYDPDTGVWTVGLSNGYGGFSTRGGTAPSGLRIQVADFNGDGLADIFGYDAATGTGVTAINSVNLQFTVRAADWGRGWRVTVARLGGSLGADLLFYNPITGAWQAAVNDGRRFTTATGAWIPGLEIHAIDLDGNGRDDVFGYAPATGQWLTALNASRGRFAVATGWSIPGASVATGDLNGDRLGDVVFYDPVSGVWLDWISAAPAGFASTSGSWLPGATLVGRPR